MGFCFEFPITVYSELQPLSPTLSLSRCRVFYKVPFLSKTFPFGSNQGRVETYTIIRNKRNGLIF